MTLKGRMAAGFISWWPFEKDNYCSTGSVSDKAGMSSSRTHTESGGHISLSAIKLETRGNSQGGQNIVPKSALPEHLQDVENNFPDDSQFGTTTWYGRVYRWLNKTTKTWFAFSYRCTEWWARWRKYPKVLFCAWGDGALRLEGEGGVITVRSDKRFLINTAFSHGYVSRVQYFCRWHVLVQWPLGVSFHWYPRASDVPEEWKVLPELDGKVVFGYWNHYDADHIHWMVISVYAGLNWK